MRILTIVKNLDYRGTQRTAQEFSLSYHSQGCNVAVLAYKEGGPREKPLHDAGIPVWIGGENLDFAIKSANLFKPDIIHIHREGLPNPIESELMRRLKGTKNRIIETNVFGRYDSSQEANLIDVHLQISKWCLYRWRRWCPDNIKLPAALIPNMIDTELFRPIEENEASRYRHQILKIPNGSFVCGRIGNWSRETFSTFSNFFSSHNNSYLVCVVDQPGIQHEIDLLPPPIRSRIIAIPKLNGDHALSLFYSSLDCLLHASKVGETFGLVLAEAMSCGCPVVTAAVPHKGNSQVEVVGHLQGGVVAGSIKNLPAALEFFHQNREIWPSLKTQARASIVNRYERRNITMQALRVAKHALDSKSPEKTLELLDRDPQITTDVSDREIQDLLNNTLGGISTRDKILMCVINRHKTYQFYQKLKTILKDMNIKIN